MNLAHLIRAVASETAEAHGIVEQIVDSAFAEIRRQLDLGHKVQIEGFGTFNMRASEPKIAPHPISGTPIEHPAFRQPVFKATNEWRKALNAGPPEAIDDREVA